MWSSKSSTFNADRAALFGGGARSSSPSQGNSGNSALMLEQQNDFRLEELSSKVSALHRVTMDINNEVHDQFNVLDGTADTFDKARGSLSGSGTRLLQMSSIRHHRYMFYVVCLILAVFFLLYLFGGYLTRQPDTVIAGGADGLGPHLGNETKDMEK